MWDFIDKRWSGQALIIVWNADGVILGDRCDEDIDAGAENKASNVFVFWISVGCCCWWWCFGKAGGFIWRWYSGVDLSGLTPYERIGGVNGLPVVEPVAHFGGEIHDESRWYNGLDGEDGVICDIVWDCAGWMVDEVGKCRDVEDDNKSMEFALKLASCCVNLSLLCVILWYEIEDDLLWWINLYLDLERCDEKWTPTGKW